VLFQNMEARFVEMRNRQLKVLREKVYHVALLEKHDLVRVEPGRVLLDLCLVAGSLRATQSARTGSEDSLLLEKGDRLESGAIVHEASECYAAVENTLERSLLVEIAAHVRFAQN
jgi:hypothetical protein